MRFLSFPHPSFFILALSITTLLGVACGSLFPREFFVLVLFASLVFGVLFRFFFPHSWRLFVFCVFLFFVISFTRAFFFFSVSDVLVPTSPFHVHITGFPEVHLDHVRYRARTPAGENILLFFNLFPRYSAGDVLLLGDCPLPRSASSGFRFDRFFLTRDIQALCFYPGAEKIGFSELPFFSRISISLLDFFYKHSGEIFHEPYSSLFLGMTVGARAGFSESENVLFTRTGTTHILAVSGYNVTLLVAVLFRIFVRIGMKRFHATIILFFFLLWYAVLTGLSASVLRATFFGMLVLFAYMLERKVQPLFLLLFIAALLAFFRPAFLLYDPGFALSFVTTFFLFASPFSSHEKSFLPNVWQLRENVSTTLIAFFATLPLTLWYFHSISLVALLVNVLVLPLVPMALAFGMCAFVLSLLPYGFFFSAPFLFITHVLLSSMWDILTFFSTWRYAAVSIFAPWYVSVMLAGFFLTFFLWKRSRSV